LTIWGSLATHVEVTVGNAEFAIECGFELDAGEGPDGLLLQARLRHGQLAAGLAGRLPANPWFRLAPEQDAGAQVVHYLLGAQLLGKIDCCVLQCEWQVGQTLRPWLATLSLGGEMAALRQPVELDGAGGSG
jgi:kynureninase